MTAIVATNAFVFIVDPNVLTNIRGKFMSLMVNLIFLMIIVFLIITWAIIFTAFKLYLFLFFLVLRAKELVVNLLFFEYVEKFVNGISLKYFIQLLKLRETGKSKPYGLKRLVHFIPNSS